MASPNCTEPTVQGSELGHRKVEEAGEPGFMTRMSNGQDCLLFPGHTPLEVLDASIGL